MKKKILFVIPDFYIGGTNKSLENLLNLIDKEKYEIKILSLYEDGDLYFKKIFKPFLLKKTLFYSLFHDDFIFRKFSSLISKLSGFAVNGFLTGYEINKQQKRWHFDTVIAYQEGPATRCVSKLRDCPNKIAWVHCDLEYWLNGLVEGRKIEEAGDYSKFNEIVCVSDAAKQSFLRCTHLSSKNVTYIYNPVDSEKIKEMASECQGNVLFDTDVFNILSVGRFSPTKQFTLIPRLVHELKKRTSKRFCWYIIASTEECLDYMLAEITKYDVSNEVILLGAQDNPYPFFKESDLYVCTSESESFSYVIAEAKVLHVPVLCNNLPVAKEVVSETEGWVCDIDEMPETLSEIINNEGDIYRKVKARMASYEYDNSDILRRFEEIV